MTACLDTGVFLQIFGRKQPFSPDSARLAGMAGSSSRFPLKFCSNTRRSPRASGAERWRDMAALLDLLAQLHGNIRHVEPKFRFNVISTDPDDNKFCDCAIAAEANFVVTEDNDFNALKSGRLQTEAHQTGRIYQSILATVTARQNDAGRPARLHLQPVLHWEMKCSEGAMEISPAHRAGFVIQNKFRPEGRWKQGAFSTVLQTRFILHGNRGHCPRLISGCRFATGCRRQKMPVKTATKTCSTPSSASFVLGSEML